MTKSSCRESNFLTVQVNGCQSMSEEIFISEVHINS